MVNYSAVICEQGHVIVYDDIGNIINRLGPWTTVEEAEDFASEYVDALNYGTVEIPAEYWVESVVPEYHETP